MHVQAEQGRPSVEGSTAGRNWQTHPGLYAASLKKNKPRSVPSPVQQGHSTPTNMKKKVYHKKLMKNNQTTITTENYEAGYREEGMPRHLIQELDVLDIKEFEVALDYWMNHYNFSGSSNVIYAYDESKYPNPKNKKTNNYKKSSQNMPISRNKAVSFACKVLIEYSQHQRLQSIVIDAAYKKAVKGRSKINLTDGNYLNEFRQTKFHPYLFARVYASEPH